MLTTLWRVLPLAPHLSREASSVILSARPVTWPHALERLFYPLASERFGDEAVLSLLNEGALPFQVSLCRIMQNTHQEVDL
jgi:hypothetical protein